MVLCGSGLCCWQPTSTPHKHPDTSSTLRMNHWTHTFNLIEEVTEVNASMYSSLIASLISKNNEYKIVSFAQKHCLTQEWSNKIVTVIETLLKLPVLSIHVDWRVTTTFTTYKSSFTYWHELDGILENKCFCFEYRKLSICLCTDSSC